MGIWKKYWLLVSQLTISLLLVCTSVQAAYHTNFSSIRKPTPFVMESTVAFGQDLHDQLWLVTDRGISLFQDNKFVPFRTFDFSSKIVSAHFIKHTVILSLQDKIVSVDLTSANSQIQEVWQGGRQDSVDQVQLSLSDNTHTLWLLTSNSIYKLDNPDKIRPDAKWQPVTVVKNSDTAKLFATEKGLYVANDDQLSFIRAADASIETQTLDFSIADIAVHKSELWALDTDGIPRPISENATPYPVSQQFNRLIGNSSYLFALAETELKTLDNQIQLTQPENTEQIYVDNQNNIWVTTPYQIYVAWYQAISATQIDKPSNIASISNKFISQDGKWAVKLNEVSKVAKGTRQLSWQEPELTNSDNGELKNIWSFEQSIWLQFNQSLVAIDLKTRLTSFRLKLSKHDIIMPTPDGKMIKVSPEQITQFNSKGQVELLKSGTACQPSCVPNFQIYQSLTLDNKIWLATNKGLHRYSLNSNEFSPSRLDRFNQLSPIVGIVPATENKLWLIYPNKVALFDIHTAYSEFYYAGHEQLLGGFIGQNNNLILQSQKGWLQLELPIKITPKKPSLTVHQLVRESDRWQQIEIAQELELLSEQDELQLTIHINKQHPQQSVQLRFKYQDEPTWTQVNQFSNGLTLKDLRQGQNTLAIQAQIEGKDWQEIHNVHYFLPYRFFQTKWVLAFVSLFLVLLFSIIAYERLQRVNVTFRAAKQQAFISSLLESTKEGVWIADVDRKIQSINQAYTDITGYNEKDVVKNSFKLISDSGRNHEVESLIWQEIIKSGFWSGEVWSKSASGEDLSIDLSVTRVESKDRLRGKSDVKYVGVFSDVTNRKKNEKDLRQLATRDPLTDLANRTLFIEHVHQSINSASPLNPHFAVVFLDLDNFKKVNENLGPLQGDKLIQLVGQRISGVLDKGIIFARLGGDEFALLVPNYLFSGVPAFYIQRLAADIQRAMQPSFDLADIPINITATLGIALYPNHGEKVETLMRCADTALNRAKSSGKNSHLIYDQIMDDMGSTNLSLESEMIAALKNDEFQVYYQPKYLLDENKIHGFEALIRWQSPTRGFVTPDQFIPIAEENGLIRSIDSYVLRKVCQQLNAWHKQGMETGKIAVNVSALNFQQSDFCHHIKKLVEEEGDLVSYIELEITETAMMTNPDRALESIETLKSYGFSIALDDFGTGYSSLGYLKKFPVDRIKIDRTFVKDIETSAEDRNIASVIMQLAKYLNKEVIAEGVENENQAYLLHVMGCNDIQGYYISRPIPAEQVPTFIETKHPRLQEFSNEGL